MVIVVFVPGMQIDSPILRDRINMESLSEWYVVENGVNGHVSDNRSAVAQ